ncbi:hypothetical protein P4H61_04100 [Paenibacillus peoriae]|uniref:ATP-dependent RNA helicase HrpA n=1 Tax=Paenibacillus peoriae TaxID=59893 RepID=UPI00026C5D6A|nr:ATP-dependent RNA helicase HrpA [Paenibacillus peoriae]MEC0180679.1 hypothetical protein [Paenibacillus peoriae]
MTEKSKFLNIGLVMPIAPIDGCSSEHWLDVKRIITESLSSMPGYNSNPKIVSEGNSSGLIHKRIVEGLYTSDIIICDVSCKNPNVMFELGMRLAFDKPTVIIKDDKTDYTFDAGVIEHLQYPRDLRYKEIVQFKELLSEKVRATYEDSLKDSDHSPFLKSFGTFKVATIKEDTVTADQYIIGAIRDIQNDISVIKASGMRSSGSSSNDLNKKNEHRKILRYVKVLLKEMISNYANSHADEMPVINSISDLTIPLEEKLQEDGIMLDFGEINQLVLDYLVDNGIPFFKI